MNTANQNKKAFWTRVMDIIFRTAHVGVISILSGGLFFDIPYDRLETWRFLAGITGVMLIFSEIYHRRHWLVQSRGIMAILHAFFFILIFIFPGLKIQFLIPAIIFGMVGSHLPRRFRHYSFLHRSVID